MDAKAVDEVHHLRAGIELPVFLALAGGQQPFKDVADDVIIEEGEVEVVDLVDERLPVGDGLVGVKGDAVADAGVVFAKDGFVIVCDFLGFLEVALQVEAQFLSLVEVLGDGEFSPSSRRSV